VQGSGQDPPPSPSPEAFEELLAECIGALGNGGGGELEELLARHPAEAPRLRERLARLDALGMLAEPAKEPTSIGPYRVERTLGQGGMSRVHLARHVESGETVALKVLHSPLLEDPRARLRFEREVVAVTSLSHPCMVAVQEAGTSDGLPWLAMEFVRGATLDLILDELRESAAPLEELDGAHLRAIARREAGGGPDREPDRGYVESVCRIVLDIAAALEHAHRFGIVHRDVKPANIMVTPEGRAKLLDLGLASLEGSPSLTRTGDFAGTPYYVAPEQARSVQEASPRSDVFSLGVTLYEALTLRRPFEGQDAAAVFRALQTRDPLPPSRHNPLLARDLETICLRALEKDPARRYASMAELARDLQRFLEFKPILARPVGRLRRLSRLARRRPSLSLLIALSALVAVGTPIALVFVNEAIREERDLARESAQRAERQAGIAEAVVDHLVELFSPSAELGGDGADWTFERMLEASVTRIPGELQQDPLLRAALLEAAGRIHADLERWDVAVPLLDRAYALRQRQLDDDHPALAATLVWLAQAHRDAGNPRAARSLARRGLEALPAEEDGPSEPAFDLRMALAQAARECDEAAEARAELETLRALCQARPARFAERVAEVEGALAELHLENGDGQEALACSDRAIAELRRAWVPDRARLLAAQELRARIQEALGDREGAARARAEASALSESFARASAGPSGEAWLAAYPLELLPPWSIAFEDAFQRGIIALQGRRWPGAIAAFESCLEIVPGHPVCLYNLACAHAGAGRPGEALSQLARARDRDFGVLQGNLEALADDPDLAPLRGRADFEALRDEIEEQQTRALRHAATPRTYRPPSVAPAGRGRLLVVLSGDGDRSGEERFAHWREVAEHGGAPLVYLEGRLAGGSSAWIAEVDNFLEDPWRVEEAPAARVRELAEELGAEAGRAILVGEGSGAPVAFDLALRAPGFFGAALLLDGAALPSCGPGALALARACGTRVHLVLGDSPQSPAMGAGPGAAERASRLEDWLREGGLAARARAVLDGGAAQLSAREHGEELVGIWAELEAAR